MKRKVNLLQKLLRYLFLILCSLILSCNNLSKKGTNDSGEIPDDYSSRIDSLIETTHPRIFNGIVLITQNGETKYLRERGYSDFEKKIPISITDKFRIMSNSKQVTAVLILREAEKGTIDLQHAISRYLPNLNQTWADTVTVHHLLNMSSGIAGLEEPLLFEPGTGYHYSNPGYGLLGRIIKKVTGKRYAEKANDLFSELGMDNTYCYEINANDNRLINGHEILEGKMNTVDFSRFEFYIDRWDDFLPAGGIVSDTYDLNTWDTKLHKGEILKTAFYEQMVNPVNSGPHAVFDNDTIGYGYGLRIHDKHPVRHIGHGGRGFGFVSIKFYIPEKEVEVIVWENIYYRDDFPNATNIIYHFENEIRKIVLNSSLAK